MNELASLMDLLSAKYGWAAAATGWITTARLTLKPVSSFMQVKMTEALQRIASSPEKDDDELIGKLLANKAYRLFAFLMDLLASVKLPTTASFNELTTK